MEHHGTPKPSRSAICSAFQPATDRVFRQVVDQLVKSGDMEALEGEVPEVNGIPGLNGNGDGAGGM